MRIVYCWCIAAIILTGCSHTYYVVRHAEKAAASGSMMSNDPPLSEAGQRRAISLLDSLRDKHIAYIYATPTTRTKLTAQPVADFFGLPIRLYGPAPDADFINKLKAIHKNTLIVGHSNTVDDIVNDLCGSAKVNGDLGENEYDNLFVITYNRFLKTKIHYARKHYGAPSGQ